MTYRSRIYATYRDLTNHHTRWEVNAPTWLDFVRRYLPTDREAAILDLGCGAGDMLRAAAHMGFRNVRGIDGSPQQVEQALRQQLPVTLGDMKEYLLTQPDESWDAVITYDVIEHLDRDEMLDIADQVRRVLRRHGRWAIHSVNADSPFFGAIRYGDITHEIAYNRQSITQLLRAAGFTRIACVEDPPLRYGAKGWLRFLLWHVVSLPVRLVWTIETGCVRSILTRNFIVIALP